MKIRVISSREEINSLRPNEKAVHLAFRASNIDFLNLLKKVPRLQMIQLPPSYMKTISDAMEVFLEMQGIELLEGDVWGHRKDIDEYFTVPGEAIRAIRSMTNEGASSEDITREIQKSARISPELIRYVAKIEMSA